MKRWHNIFIASILSIGMVSAGVLHAEDSDSKKKKNKNDKSDPNAPKFQIVVPKDQPAKGIHLPYYNLQNVLRMQFDADVAVRTGENTIDLTNLRIESFDEAGKSEMLVNLPTATLDMTTNLITSTDNVTVKRKDFQITGKGMEFNTQEKSGRLFSNIQMEIFDRSAMKSNPSSNQDSTPASGPSPSSTPSTSNGK